MIGPFFGKIFSSPSNADGLLDRVSIWTTRLLVFSLPMTLIHPTANPHFHRMQIAEFFSVGLLMITGFRIFFRQERITRPNGFFISLAAYVMLLYGMALMSNWRGPALLESTTILYLGGTAYLIYHNASKYLLYEDLWKWTTLTYVVILGGGVVGIILVFFGIDTMLAYQSRIIPIALGLTDWFSSVPRVLSLMSPTATMVAVYWAVMTLPVLTFLGMRDQKGLFRRFGIILILGIFLLGLFTLSRPFVGVVLAIYLGLRVMKWEMPLRSLLAWGFLCSAIGAFSILLFFSVLHPLGGSIRYSNDPTIKKEKVEIYPGFYRPNPVYILRDGIGLERISIQFDYSINHYAWLKYSAWKIMEEWPWFGSGLGNFTPALKRLQEKNILPRLAPEDNDEFPSAQSQYATLLAETGVVGFLAAFFVLMALVFEISKRYHRRRDPRDLAIALSLLVLAISSIDNEVMSFRWLWGLWGLSLVRYPEGTEADG